MNCTKLSLLADLRPDHLFVVYNAIIIAAHGHISLNDKVVVAIVLLLTIVSFDKRNKYIERLGSFCASFFL